MTSSTTSSASTTDFPAGTSTPASPVDGLLDAIEAGAGGAVAALYAADARLDATVPGWRFSRTGGAGIAAEYERWFRHPGRFEELDRLPAPGGEVVRYLLAWSEDGVPHAAHHCHLLTVDAGSGRITAERVFCGGRWDAALMAAMEEEAAAAEARQLAEVALALTPRPVAGSLEELLEGAEARAPFATAETRSGSRFERVWMGGQALVLKHIQLDDDFTMRASGDIGCRPLRAFAAGLLDVAPDLVDHGIIAAARGVGRNGWWAALLMRDVSGELVPPGDNPFPEEDHASFIDHLAGLCARTWGWRDDVGLLAYGDRWRFFGPDVLDWERRLGWPEPVPRIAAEGWLRFADRATGPVARSVDDLRHDVTPLAAALASTPSCLLHGDWKASNLGTAPDGRTVLIDWAYVGEGPAGHELGWYLALNRAKLPVGHSRERVIEDFGAALVRHGVPTGRWWDRQLRLALLGTVVQFGWERRSATRTSWAGGATGPWRAWRSCDRGVVTRSGHRFGPRAILEEGPGAGSRWVSARSKPVSTRSSSSARSVDWAARAAAASRAPATSVASSCTFSVARTASRQAAALTCSTTRSTWALNSS